MYSEFKHEYLGGSRLSKIVSNLVIDIIELYRKTYKEALANSNRFYPQNQYRKLLKALQNYFLGRQTGEGWFLTGEMIELIESGVKILSACGLLLTQPCYRQRHDEGTKRVYPGTNIVAIDYDRGEGVNQLNRIKLMITTAFENIKEFKESKAKAYLDDSYKQFEHA